MGIGLASQLAFDAAQTKRRFIGLIKIAEPDPIRRAAIIAELEAEANALLEAARRGAVGC